MRLGIVVSKLSAVPGCYESPLMVKERLSKNDVDGVVVLGSIVKETSSRSISSAGGKAHGSLTGIR